MKINLRVILIVIGINIIFVFGVTNASFEYILKNDLLGPYEILGPIPSIDDYILKEITSIKKKETGEDFNCPPSITGRTAFSEMPGILLYSLYAGGPSGLHYRDPYEVVLIDTSSREIFHFEGKVQDFNQVLKRQFAADMTPYFAQDIIRLYLSTRNARYSYYMLNSYLDFQAFYDRQLSFFKEYGFTQDSFYLKLLADMDSVRAISKDLTWAQTDSTFRFKFDCLNWHDHTLERWIIDVNVDGLKIIEKTDLINNLGTPDL